MDEKHLMNFLENKYIELKKDFKEDYKYDYLSLYSSVTNEKLSEIFSLIHYNLNKLFDIMNSRIRKDGFSGYFKADDSRDLIKVIEITFNLYSGLENTKLAFNIVEKYYSYMVKCKEFLKQSGGSTIPNDMLPIELYQTMPIFEMAQVRTINNIKETINVKRILVGEGSYAFVYKFTDPFYNITFAEKKIKNKVSDKELERFKREYKEMKQLSSPYILEVYNYDEKSNSYIMEYMDSTLFEYISRNNQDLTYQQRKSMVLQVLKAINYLHSKNILHRDISYNNILVKKYENQVNIKISDFGLVKVKDSELTNTQTDFKGSLNDPALKNTGFKEYNKYYEMYPLGSIINFIMTGRKDINNTNNDFKAFFNKCTCYPVENRYKDIEELTRAFKQINWE